MPFGTPTSQESFATYGATLEHSNGVKIRISVDDPAAVGGVPADMDAAMQAAVDGLNALSDWTFIGGAKSYTTNVSMTATP